jgi:MoxR-like ATPase
LEILDAAKETADKVAGLKSGDRKAYISQAAQALETFTQQMARLTKLSKSAGRRAKDTIDTADADITAMHEELARAVSSGLGLRRAEK